MVSMQQLLSKLRNTGSTAYATMEEIDSTSMVEKIKDGVRYVMPSRYDRLEQEVAERLMTLAYVPAPTVSDKLLKKYIRDYERSEGRRLNVTFRLAEHQKSAIEIAVKNRVFMLTGGPGMGKTCVVKGIISVMKMFHPTWSVAFCASTGKAARNLAGAVQADAKTIQSAIGLQDPDEPLTKTLIADIVVIDEVSMLDLVTFAAILRSLKPGTRLIIVGDPDQLPSVGEGAVLRDLMQANTLLPSGSTYQTCIPWEALSVPQRQKADSVLYKDIFNIRFAETATLFENTDRKLIAGNDFRILKPSEDVLNQIVELYVQLKEEYNGSVAVLTPFRRVGQTCANVVNAAIQARVNPDPKGVFEGTVVDCTGDYPVNRDVRFCVGDPVMQLKNRKAVSNGEIGRVLEINKGVLTVEFERGKLEYTINEMGDLDLAYAMSVHKSQGSEYKAVVTLALKEHEKLLSRNLVYTAVTRAKQICYLICEAESFKKAVLTDASANRVTFLVDKLKEQKRKHELVLAAKKFFGAGGHPLSNEALDFIQRNKEVLNIGLGRQCFAIPTGIVKERALESVKAFLLSLNIVATATLEGKELVVITQPGG